MMLPNWTYPAGRCALFARRWVARFGCLKRPGRPAEGLGSPCLAQFGLDWFDLAALGVSGRLNLVALVAQGRSGWFDLGTNESPNA